MSINIEATWLAEKLVCGLTLDQLKQLVLHIDADANEDKAKLYYEHIVK